MIDSSALFLRPVRRPRPALAVLAAALLALGACSPALDWRDARLGGPVKLLLPCKADRIERTLVLAGAPSPALMLVCDADGVTWSVTRYELGDPARLPAALTELHDKLARNIGGEAHPQPGTLPPGATALAQAGRSHMAGQRPNGDKVQAQALFFGEASRAYQLVAILPATATPRLLAQTSQFFDGVQITR